LACGVPAIVTDFPGQANLIRNGNCGLVIPHDNAEELARAIKKLADDPASAKAMGQRAHSLIAEGHSWDVRASQTYDILKKIIDERE
jgi:glycosyltransferase involved in cell wall biosynthesis